MKNKFLILGLFILSYGCSQPAENSGGKNETVVAQMDTANPVEQTPVMDSTPAVKQLEKTQSSSDIEIRTFKNDGSIGGFGYDIYKSGHLYVHQPHIPAVSGNRGFSSEEFARKAGGLVMYKIQHNVSPPSVNEKELDSIGVLK